jgi:predicted alpha/beta hydrolase family esterase
MVMENLDCMIIHGCPSNVAKAMNTALRTYNKHWIQWLKKELNSRGIKTQAPLMPSPWNPVYEKFRRKFEKYKVTENSTLVGHSCGCAFLVRWLGDSKQKVKKLILVAPWKIANKDKPLKKAFRKAFYEYSESIKSRVGEIIMFTADNEKEEGKKSLEIYKNSLGGRIIELKGRGHYIFKDMGTKEFPELLREII